MPSPPIQIFLTTIASQPALRQRQESLLRILQVKKIPYTAYDLASDESAKKLWRRKAPADKQQLPGILVGGKFPGTFAQFEEAVEYHELPIFLRLNEEYDPEIEQDRPLLASQPVGVPGVMTPSQSTPIKYPKPSPSPSPSPSPLRSKGKDGKWTATPPDEGKSKGLKVVNKEESVDLGEELVGFGLQGVRATEDELAELIKELGLDGDEAKEMARDLSGGDGKSEEKVEKEVKEEDKAEVVKSGTKEDKSTAEVKSS
ncbi:hypothetical protein JAAARDRAFT_188997 [Jaapia argillacea MUCL 33604]|uniref:Uncharacterized protein n=1 Tax=Jaapia argillacea MUCL 33604 TaxID=933084 RepID=A0A067QBC9_9AGAM|nr:hypothetical protein JAAARDRAFT_188997 [Jaapia argillacea MUCL 33604]